MSLPKKTQLIFFFFLLGHLVSAGLGAQNPFDIKKPNGTQSSTKTEVKKEEPKVEQKSSVNTTATKQINTSVPASGASAVSQSATTTNKPSGNIFDIKAGTSGNPNTQVNPAPQSPNTTQTSQAPPVLETQPTINPSIPRDSVSSGLQGVQNPFNILPGGGNPANPTTSSTETTVAPLSELKDQINILNQSSISPISKNTWFIIYLFLFLLAAIAINFNRAYPLALIKATYNQNQLRMLFKDAFKGNHTFIFGILYFLFIVNAGIFIYLSFKVFHIGSMSLIQAIALVFVVYLVRHLVLFILGVVFPLTKEAVLFNYTIGVHNLTLGLALMLINILLSFVDAETGKMLIFSGLSVTLVLYLMRQARGLLNNVPTIIGSKFHFIIYLCTVEIAPWMLLTGILLR